MTRRTKLEREVLRHIDPEWVVATRGKVQARSSELAEVLVPPSWPAVMSTRARVDMLALMNALEELTEANLAQEFILRQGFLAEGRSDTELRRLVHTSLEVERSRLLSNLHGNICEILEQLEEVRKQIASMNTRRLHALADDHNWDDGHLELFWIIESQHVSLATAALIYWRSRPDVRIEPPLPWNAELASLRQVLVERIQRRRFAPSTLTYDVAGDLQLTGRALTAALEAVPAALRFSVRKGAAFALS